MPTKSAVPDCRITGTKDNSKDVVMNLKYRDIIYKSHFAYLSLQLAVCKMAVISSPGNRRPFFLKSGCI